MNNQDVGIRNSFRFIGQVASKTINPRTTQKGIVCNFLIAIPIGKNNWNYFPIVCYGKKVVELASQFCEYKNIIAVNGWVGSISYFNRELGTNQIRVVFYATDIMLLGKKAKRKFSDKDFSTLIGLYKLEDEE